METIELVSWINKLIQEKNIHAFYVSGVWKKLRKDVLEECNNDCQLCKAKGKASTATTVHHVAHLKEHPELALTRSNLMAVCKECHNELHPEKHFKYKQKIAINEEKW